MARYEMRNTRYEIGSALILAVVLTSLLAIVGVMFIMVARVDKVSTSAISENRELNFAIETVVALVSQELALDVPRVSTGNRDYHDYPGEDDKWLASLEPYKDGTDYKWRQISDVTGFLNDKGFSTQNVNVKPVGLSTTVYVREYPVITLDGNGELKEQSADADGDGIADSKWVELDGITSNKSKPIYAAIRVVDNGGMLNVNTAYKFNPNAIGVTASDIDGSSQTQINLLALSERGSTVDPLGKLDDKRFGYEPLPHVLDDYIEDVVWRYNEPNGRYTPFDISDDLELRNRFLLEIESIDTAIETFGWVDVFTGDNYLHTPVDGTSSNLDDWFGKAQYDLSEPNATENYSYRHIGTIYNMDRIIRPNGDKMLNVNKADKGLLYTTISTALRSTDPNFADANDVAAQITVNLIDYRDIDSDVTDYNNPDDGKIYYGFERPCVYISELAHAFKLFIPPGGPVGAKVVYKSYAVELYKPYSQDDDPCDWRLVIDNVCGIDWSSGEQFHVIRNQHPNAPLPPIDPNAVVEDCSGLVFGEDSLIELQRRVDDVNDVWVTVDSTYVPDANDATGWLVPDLNGIPHSIQRDITLHKCIRRLWDPYAKTPTLGKSNTYAVVGDSIYIQAHPYLDPSIYPEGGFRNIGEIGKLFCEDVYSRTWNSTDTESDVRLNLADPNYHGLFKYLTVFDPTDDGINNDGDRRTDGTEIIDEDALNETPEWKIPGRININTAPWYVMAQLPWVSDELAQAIVAYRDKLDLSPGGPNYTDRSVATGIANIREEFGFESIGELNFVIDGSDDYRIDYYATVSSGGDLAGFPDLTRSDGAVNDFEERDVIFARISNLITVRSDVFTAYILVRIGTDGPQKRVIAILDRSNVYSPTDKVRVIALHSVPDPR